MSAEPAAGLTSDSRRAGKPASTSAPRTPGASSQRGALRVTAGVGLVARGVVYGLIGVLSLELAFGAGGKTESQSGALKTISNQALGDVLLIIVAVGLGCYALWRGFEGVVGIRRDEDGAIQRRISAAASAIGYAALCYTAIKIVTGGHASSGSPKPETAGVLGWPGGPVLVAIAGGVVIGVGVYQCYRGLSRGFEEDSEVGRSIECCARSPAADPGVVSGC